MTSPSPPSVLGHISLGVKDITVSEAFYTAVLSPLGLRLVYKSKPNSPAPRTLGYGPDEEHELVNLFEYGDDAHAPGRGFHLAFNAPSREAVEQFHAAAVQSGGRSNGAPGVREWYGPTYFAAFVYDPDGWRLEAVCKKKD